MACEELANDSVAPGGEADDAQYNAGNKEVIVIVETIPHKKILVDTGGASRPMIGGTFFALGLVSLGVALLRRT